MAKALRSFDHFALLGVGRVCAPFVDRGSRLAAAEEKFAATRLHGPVMRRVHPEYTCSKLRQLLIGGVHALLRAIWPFG